MTDAPRQEPVEASAVAEAAGGPGGPGFAHASEAEFARILDFYQVEWRYEPHAFPILWSLDGDVLESFAPDFYLPELDLFVEMTTLRQKLVRKKNRKLRRLRELYPDVRIKLFYARDFRALMLKYGRVALADALSGAEGQFTPANPGPAVEPDASGRRIRAGREAATPAPHPAHTGTSSRSSADLPVGAEAQGLAAVPARPAPPRSRRSGGSPSRPGGAAGRTARGAAAKPAIVGSDPDGEAAAATDEGVVG